MHATPGRALLERKMWLYRQDTTYHTQLANRTVGSPHGIKDSYSRKVEDKDFRSLWMRSFLNPCTFMQHAVVQVSPGGHCLRGEPRQRVGVSPQERPTVRPQPQSLRRENMV